MVLPGLEHAVSSALQIELYCRSSEQLVEQPHGVSLVGFHYLCVDALLGDALHADVVGFISRFVTQPIDVRLLPEEDALLRPYLTLRSIEVEVGVELPSPFPMSSRPYFSRNASPSRQTALKSMCMLSVSV